MRPLRYLLICLLLTPTLSVSALAEDVHPAVSNFVQMREFGHFPGQTLADIKKRAKAGNAEDQYHLGQLYMYGWSMKRADGEWEGGVKDEAEALKWFLKAADQGYANAELQVGEMYSRGYGVQKDTAKAAKWYGKHADQTGAESQFRLGLMYAHGNYVPENKAEAMKWVRKAADQGYADAQCKLGEMYLNGDGGVHPDEVEAYAWFHLCAENNSEAKEERNRLSRILTPESKARAIKRADELTPKTEKSFTLWSVTSRFCVMLCFFFGLKKILRINRSRTKHAEI
jgi:TPR repeat protein